MKVENKIIPSEEQINGFLENPDLGPISMVNLLKYYNIFLERKMKVFCLEKG